MGYAVYVLLNPQGKIYIGQTNNLALDSAPASKWTGRAILCGTSSS